MKHHPWSCPQRWSSRRGATRTSGGERAAGKRGFTLVELLVVIVIIGVLVGIALPVLSKMQASSRTVKCANNLRQIGMGMISFAGDNNMSLPAGSTWDQQIATYLGITNLKTAASVLTCPEDPRPPTLPAGTFARSYTTNGVNANSVNESYGMFSDTAMPASRRLNNIKGATTILVLEFFTGTGTGNYQFKTPFAWTTPYNDPTEAPRLANGRYYHGATENFLFADGHVASMDPGIAAQKGQELWAVW